MNFVLIEQNVDLFLQLSNINIITAIIIIIIIIIITIIIIGTLRNLFVLLTAMQV